MAKIKLVDIGWTLISEGHHVFKVVDATYNEDFGKIEVDMITQNGEKHNERYGLITKSGKLNEGAQKAFSFFAKTALNNMALDEIDVTDLIGCYVSADVEHVESDTVSEKTGQPFVNARLNNLKHEVGFTDDEPAAAEEVADEVDEIDADDWLNS